MEETLTSNQSKQTYKIQSHDLTAQEKSIVRDTIMSPRTRSINDTQQCVQKLTGRPILLSAKEARSVACFEMAVTFSL